MNKEAGFGFGKEGPKSEKSFRNLLRVFVGKVRIKKYDKTYVSFIKFSIKNYISFKGMII